MAITSPGSMRVRAMRSKPCCDPLTMRISSGRASMPVRSRYALRYRRNGG